MGDALQQPVESRAVERQVLRQLQSLRRQRVLNAVTLDLHVTAHAQSPQYTVACGWLLVVSVQDKSSPTVPTPLKVSCRKIRRT